MDLKIKKTINLSCGLICKEIEQYIAKANNDLAKALKKAGFVDSKYTISQSEKLEKQLTKILDDNTDEFIKLLNDNSDKEISDIIKELPEHLQSLSIKEQVTNAFKLTLGESIPYMSNKYFQGIDKELKLEKMTNRTTYWIDSWSDKLSEMMNVNTGSEIKDILIMGMNDGKSIQDIAYQLIDNGTLDNITRARKVAITEMLRANSVAAEEAYIQSPAVTHKMWRHSGGKNINPRQNHIDMDGQIVLMSEYFTMIGSDGGLYMCSYPRDIILPPRESINCHCIHQPIVDESVLGLSLEERKEMQLQCIENDNNKFW